MKNLIIIILMTFTIQAEQATIDTVYSFIPGKGTIRGNEPENYPQNIFGLPSKNATLKVPVNAPNEILSIGIGGEIIVGFRGKKVVNIEGADFTIFENAFETFDGSRIFAEPAEVWISNDGINYTMFQYERENLYNLAGKTPTLGVNDPFDPTASGGDSFDIAELGYDYITHIKIKDVSLLASELDNENRYYNPAALISGFDLDAVVAMQTEDITSSVKEYDTIKYDEAKYYDLLGNEIDENNSQGYYIVLYLRNNNVIKLEKKYK
jgi:hypothetical protein